MDTLFGTIHSRRNALILGCGLTCVAILFGFSVLTRLNFGWPFFQQRHASFEEIAATIITTCVADSYRPGCYDKEIPKLMETLSLEDAFAITRIIQEKDGEYWYCHVLGHELSSIETAKNPDTWKDVVARCPSDMCSNGCLHGAFQERFRAEALPDADIDDLVRELDGVCEEREDWHPTALSRATCYHALGHLTMYITDGNLERSTRLCERVAKEKENGDFSPLCFDGAFMQIFQPLEPEDFALIEGKQPTKKTLASFCAPFTGEKYNSCWSEGWPLFRAEIETPTGLTAFCGKLDNNEGKLKRCYRDLIYVLTAQFNFDEDRISSLCAKLPGNVRGECFASAASRMVETDWRLVKKSVSVCTRAASVGRGDVCFEELLFSSRYNFEPGSGAFINFCTGLPAPWEQRCLKRE